jgi:hypothetical protein
VKETEQISLILSFTRREKERSCRVIGVSPSGKALDFDSSIPRFESWHPSHTEVRRKHGVYEKFNW